MRQGASLRSSTKHRTKRKRTAPSRRKRLRPAAVRRRAWARRFRALPGALQIMLGLAAAVLLLAILNWIYQVARKPSELLFPVSGVLYKSPAETWRTYGPLFRMHSTAIMTPELLAALAQTEGSGNPVARTYWRWRMSSRPFDLYRPASSAVGMYQITNGTFGIARRYCIHGHRVVADGPWDDFHSCWFNALYTRTLPSDAVELTSAYLTKAVGDILLRNGRRTPRLEQQRQLAVLIHLCGAGAGELYARRGLHLAPGQRCGDHSARDYLERVLAMQRTFVSIARRNPSAAGV